ncbi:hypothetical protein [Flammeovirga sp. OC4]|uniref:hypothetical protein n=1 Tax=Flammeovirga sp. OC4 TaxID=1382345 RepID=UPI0005C71EBA|nr:hypothetical protein [Flammeovirga sp. OC4]
MLNKIILSSLLILFTQIAFAQYNYIPEKAEHISEERYKKGKDLLTVVFESIENQYEDPSDESQYEGADFYNLFNAYLSIGASKERVMKYYNLLKKDSYSHDSYVQYCNPKFMSDYFGEENAKEIIQKAKLSYQQNYENQ